MFVNGVNCDIYIGTGAGKKLLADIESAKSSVKIISPYLSASLVSQLIDLKNRFVEVELITEDTIEDFKDRRNIKKLIIQHPETDQKAVEKRERMSKITIILLIVAIVVLLLFFFAVYRFQDPSVYLGIVPVLSAFLIYGHYRNAVRDTVIYKYSYSTLFPIKVISGRKSGQTGGIPADGRQSIHSKIYLIDNRIAYLGSLNFTVSGTQDNYETRIRTEDPDAVAKISQEYDRMMQSSDYSEKDLRKWGREVYAEPIN